MPKHRFRLAIRNNPVCVTYQWLFSNARSPDPISKCIADRCSRGLSRICCFPTPNSVLANRRFREYKSVLLFIHFDLLRCNAIVTHIASHRKSIHLASLLAYNSTSCEFGMPKTETLNLRVSTEFKKRLMEEAAREKRSVTNYLEATITAVWEQRQNRQTKVRGKKQQPAK